MDQFTKFLESKRVVLGSMELLPPDSKSTHLANEWENYQRTIHNAKICRKDELQDYKQKTSHDSDWGFTLKHSKSKYESLHTGYGITQQDQVIAIYINELNSRLLEIVEVIEEARERLVEPGCDEVWLEHYQNRLVREIKYLQKARRELGYEKIIRQLRGAQIKKFLKRKTVAKA